jgi:hypothetical protein
MVQEQLLKIHQASSTSPISVIAADTSSFTGQVTAGGNGSVANSITGNFMSELLPRKSTDNLLSLFRRPYIFRNGKRIPQQDIKVC